MAETSAVGNIVDLEAGQILLPGFVTRRADGLWVDISALDSPALFTQFVERVFAAGARFQNLDYPLFLNLLYHWGPEQIAPMLEEFERKAKAPEMWLAADILPFPEQRRALYRNVKIIEGGGGAEYLFEPVMVEREVQEPVFGEPDAEGNCPVVSMEIHTFSEQMFLDVDEFVADLWVKGIRYGIDVAAVREIIERNKVERLTVAKKLLPVEGKDASVNEQTDLLHRDDAPALRSDGRMDLSHFRNRFPQVTAGTRLFKKIPRTLGVSGWDVQGKELAPVVVKDFDIVSLSGPGTQVLRESHGEYVVATMDGFLNIDTQSGQISVTEKIINKEGVSMRTTGNLALAGDQYEEHGEVQEKRKVEGHHMTFMADVFGRIHSSGGNILLKSNIRGGEAISAGGSVTVEGSAAQSTLDARGGDVVLVAAENCIIFGARVKIERAVRCQIVADSIEIGVSEGSAMAAKSVSIQVATTRRDEPSFVTLLLPDLSSFAKELANLEEARVETEGEITLRRADMETLAADPDLKSYLSLAPKVKAGTLVIDKSKQDGWTKLQQRAAPKLRQLAALRAENDAAAKQLEEFAADKTATEAARDAAGQGIRCAIAEVRGDTQVRWLRRPYDETPLSNLPARELQLVLKAAGRAEERIFSGDAGSVEWQPAGSGAAVPVASGSDEIQSLALPPGAN